MAGPGHYVAFVLLAVASLLLGILGGHRVPKRRAPLLLAPFVLLSVLYAVCRCLPDWEAAIFPWPFYAFWQLQWVYLLGLFTLGCGGAALPVRWNRRVVYALALAIFAWSLRDARWMLQWPRRGSSDPAGAGRVVQQSTGYTCAPSSCAMLLSTWGIPTSEQEMSRLCLCVPEKGTTDFDVYRGLVLASEGRGLHAKVVRAGRENLTRLVRPFILLVDAHAFVVVDVRGAELLVADPLCSRPVTRSIDWALRTWNGIAVLLCREGPYDGSDAPALGAWLAAAPR